jgi:hypothetical protein
MSDTDVNGSGRHRADPLAELNRRLAVIARLQGQMAIQFSQLAGEADLIEYVDRYIDEEIDPDGVDYSTVPETEKKAAQEWADTVQPLADEMREAYEPTVTDLSARLAPYTAATEDVPRDVVCAVLDALAVCDLSVAKPLLGELRAALSVQRTAADFDVVVDAEVGIKDAHARLCGLLVTEGVWPQQPDRRREQLFTGRAD